MFLIRQVIFLLVSFTVFIVSITTESYRLGYFILTGLTVIIHFVELNQEYKSSKPHFFINPIFVSTLVTFGLALGGITNFLLVSDGKPYVSVVATYLNTNFYWLVKAMYMVTLASSATWIGYRSGLGRKIFRFLNESLGYQKILNRGVNRNLLIIFIAVAYLSKLYLFSIGLYGRLVSDIYFDQASGFTFGSQIRILSDLSYLTFILVCYLRYTTEQNFYKNLFYITLGLELFFAFLYGARGPILFPIMIVMIVSYYIKNHLRYSYFVYFGIVVIFAFSVVLSFKNYVVSDQFSHRSSPIEVLTDFKEYFTSTNQTATIFDYDEMYITILASMNFTTETAMAIRYKDEDLRAFNEPNHMMEIIISPYNAFVPAFIQGTNEPRWGYWFKNEVLGHAKHLNYSIAYSPIGFLYIAGGVAGVIVGFFIFGVLLQLCYGYLFLRKPFALVQFIMLLFILYNFNTVFSGTIVNVLRTLFLLPFFYLLLSKKSR